MTDDRIVQRLGDIEQRERAADAKLNEATVSLAATREGTRPRKPQRMPQPHHGARKRTQNEKRSVRAAS
jgi:hypothetical protein